MKELKDYVRTIPDYPHEGIMFRDVTSVIQDPDGLKLAIDSMLNCVKDLEFDKVVGPESRGFVFGMPIAYLLNKGFCMVRKKGKLPYKTIEASYELEYGSATVEMHIDAIKPGEKVVIIDDLIATGGTLEAIIEMVEKLGGEVVKIVTLMELCGIPHKEKLSKYNMESVISYEGK
ncbi:MAG: adenine phosphoribosyltransferase [Lachnospiraceae bacterium]|nr:adenine phosphoribosyltransferase [Lachnospiraceae bacterium]